MKRRRRSPWKRRVAAVGLLVVVAGVSYGFERGRVWLVAEGRFPITEIRVEGNDLLWEGEVLETARVERGTNLFRLDAGEVERRLEEWPWIRSARVRRRPPGTVRIRVEEARPWLLALEGGEARFVDRSGVEFPTLGKEERIDLPLLTGPAARRGEVVPLLAAAFPPDEDWVSRCAAEVRIDSSGAVAFREMRFGARVRFGADRFARKAARLESVLREWERCGRGFGELDLRFRDQAIARGAPRAPRGRSL
ncbi:MAG: FtsQ-type POTRA domain-containing protein [Candidatus Eisenbacteria bacterium]|nr:FtsQ-type POTRA domain-containing protein [Candidatus Eisenbacteria bacterium]